ncbi:unnamed protein product [Cyclocybe aegerita]|uniref:Uncharacterized protein n=1 Tax=Cyclocybe aegerita TaxID=1973307 RepID=A0A8S0W172_CYCAE|nr:unnamed protein product [Cyclocybe aegerita]
MPSQWTQHEEDSYRLPEGFKRISYDADTRRYTFVDTNTGVHYQGEPDVEYGRLTPLSSSTASVDRVRPGAFAHSNRSGTLPPYPGHQAAAPMSFSDILPPELITSSTLSGKQANKRSMSAFSSSTKNNAPREQLVEAARHTGLPKLQGVVNSLGRSMTTFRKPKPTPGLPSTSGPGFGGRSGYQPMNGHDQESLNERRGLIRNHSIAESASGNSMDRTSTSSTTRDLCYAHSKPRPS